MFCFIFHCLGSSSSLVPRTGAVGGKKCLYRKKRTQIHIPRGVKVMGFFRVFLDLKSVRRQFSMSFHISSRLTSRGPSLNGLYFKLFFQGGLYTQEPWKKEILSPSRGQGQVCLQSFMIKIVSLWNKGQACLLGILKDLHSLYSRFFSFSVTYRDLLVSSGSLCHSVRTEAQGTMQENADNLALSNKVFCF